MKHSSIHDLGADDFPDGLSKRPTNCSGLSPPFPILPWLRLLSSSRRAHSGAHLSRPRGNFDTLRATRVSAGEQVQVRRFQSNVLRDISLVTKLPLRGHESSLGSAKVLALTRESGEQRLRQKVCGKHLLRQGGHLFRRRQIQVPVQLPPACNRPGRPAGVMSQAPLELGEGRRPQLRRLQASRLRAQGGGQAGRMAAALELSSASARADASVSDISTRGELALVHTLMTLGCRWRLVSIVRVSGRGGSGSAPAPAVSLKQEEIAHHRADARLAKHGAHRLSKEHASRVVALHPERTAVVPKCSSTHRLHREPRVAPTRSCPARPGTAADDQRRGERAVCSEEERSHAG